MTATGFAMMLIEPSNRIRRDVTVSFTPVPQSRSCALLQRLRQTRPPNSPVTVLT